MPDGDTEDFTEEPVDPVEPLALAEPEAPVLPAAATLDEATNVVTITTDPEETGTIHIVASRTVDEESTYGSPYSYDASVLLVPEGVEMSETLEEAFDRGDNTYYSDFISELGIRELGHWAFDPAVADDEAGAIPDFVYSEGAEPEFTQIYASNYGDGDRLGEIIEVADEDSLTDFLEVDIIRPVVEGTAGNDTLSSSQEGSEDRLIEGMETLSGLAGDDVLLHEGYEYSNSLTLEGGIGNDTLIANDGTFGQQTTLDGGAGDDVLRSDVELSERASGNGPDTFITGEGADRIEITTFGAGSLDSDNIDLGLVGRVTDFTQGEDMILIDPSQLVAGFYAPDDGNFDGAFDEIDRNADRDLRDDFTHEFTLREDVDGAYTDLDFTFTANQNGAQMTGTLRLEGLVDITESDIAFAQLETAAPMFTRIGIFSSAFTTI
ncbi:hypothetical protein OS189_11485 [Sulfitobacter sp. F26169L]|uniref:hypothetical protein n=1 Tax=Sulfitobacter sp. F26169L TaxID=2996015 RepID=UPI002260E5CF|nr:hypothetical protein [Sulfitobacter sp. F26169L]MCX7566963.1 hypothetical protein [Sulfitobacter sp. F26169L]